MTLTTSEIEQFLQVCERAEGTSFDVYMPNMKEPAPKGVDQYFKYAHAIAPELAREVLELREKLKIAIDLFEDIIDPAMKGFEIQLSKEALEKIK